MGEGTSFIVGTDPFSTEAAGGAGGAMTTTGGADQLGSSITSSIGGTGGGLGGSMIGETKAPTLETQNSCRLVGIVDRCLGRKVGG